MPLTYREAKETLARFAGTGGLCADNPEVDMFTRQVMDYLLLSGSYGNVHKFCFCSVGGCITIPFELETPLKVKVDGVVGTVWDFWQEFHATKFLDACLPADNSLSEDPNVFPTVYPLPAGGAQVGVLGFCEEDCTARIIVQGRDPTGREIITTHNGEQIVGEHLTIRKGIITHTQVVFGEITGIVKSETVGYVQLVWIKPAYNQKGFLADYSPLETNPSYRRFNLKPVCGCANGFHKISVLGRIRLKQRYTDNDYVPFSNRYALMLAGQAVNANFNTNPDAAIAFDKQLMVQIERENEYKGVNNGSPIEVFIPTSGGAIRGIVGEVGFGFRRRY